MYKLVILLKQHTPLIHFQHYQDGATLRATEVKPKLDKFIIDKLGGIDQLKKEHLDWFSGNGDLHALDYKLRVVSSDPLNLTLACNGPKEKKSESGDKIYVYETDNFPMFLSNMGGKEDKDELKNFSFHKKVSLIFIINNIKLKDEIKKLIADFLMITNFGNRQTKGFGSFYIHPSDLLFKEPISRYFFNLEYDVEMSDNKIFNRLFSNIDLFYRALRSGINQKRRLKEPKSDFLERLKNVNRYHQGGDGNDYEEILYFKSLLFLYAKNVAHSQWEKKTIKTNFYPLSKIVTRSGDILNFPYRLDEQLLDRSKNNYDNESPLFYDNTSKFIFKDLLGLSTEESWLSYNRDVIKKGQARLKSNKEFELVPEKEQSINRYTSPLLIKPIEGNTKGKKKNFTILLFNKESINPEKKLQGSHFMISNKKGVPFPLQVYPDFSLASFLNFIFSTKNWNIKTHVEKKFQDCDEFILLEKIFTEIEKNLNP